MFYIRAVSAVAQLDRFAVFGMFADDFTRGLGGAAPGRCLCDNGDGAVQTDCENIVIRAQLYVAVVDFQIRAEPADAGDDHVAAFWMRSYRARQRQKRQCKFQVDVRRHHAAEQ